MAAKHQTFPFLDGMRGVAALVVVFVHMHDGFGLPLFASGYLAVDLFFVLSGFVLENAYGQKLRGGWPWLEFAKTRLIRLWPLYLLSLAICAVRIAVQIKVGARPPSTGQIAWDFGTGLFFLPSPTTYQAAFDPIIPLILPAWSLFFELVVNAIWSLGLFRLSRRGMAVLCTILFCAVLLAVIQSGSLDIGNKWHNFVLGFARAAFSFFVGVALRYLTAGRAAKGRSIGAMGVTALMAALLWSSPGQWRPLFDIGSVALLFPAIVLTGAMASTPAILLAPLRTLGRLSYAIYVIHLPLVTLCAAVLKRTWPTYSEYAWTGWLLLAGVIVFCLVADACFDEPIRRLLTRRFIRSSATTPPGVALQMEAPVSNSGL